MSAKPATSEQTVGCGERCLLAHNLNNRLAVIIGHCELLAEQALDPDWVARLEIIHKTAKSIADEVNRHHCQIIRLLQK